MSSQSYDEDAAMERRRQRIQEARRRKRKQRLIRRLLRIASLPIGAVLLLVLLFSAGKGLVNKLASGTEKQSKATESIKENSAENIAGPTADLANSGNTDTAVQTALGNMKENISDPLPPDSGEMKILNPHTTAQTQSLFGNPDINSGYAVVIDAKTGEILAQKNAESRINPASMTKILTVLVAAEAMPNLDDTFMITSEIIDFCFSNDCSNVGFEKDEIVTVRDLFYGTILSSGGDASAALAIYTAGSMEAFVDKMNDKLKELGLSDTAHFTNFAGLYDGNHYCTVTDMAIILKAALDNELCREVLSAHTYTTSETKQHPEGITISNWFLRKIEDKDSGGEVICAKTGYTAESKNCAASYAEDASGRGYICVTAYAGGNWPCIYDHVDLYKQILS